MELKIENKDVFAVGPEYYFAHCIASDFRMGKGIAVEFERRFHLKAELAKMPAEQLKHPACVLVGRVFNLITKAKSTGKPTLSNMRLALSAMAQKVDDLKAQGVVVDKIAMPLIGCGLDQLEGSDVRQAIKDAFAMRRIEILVCFL